MQTPTPNHVLQRTAAGRRSCNRSISWAPSLRFGRWALKTVAISILLLSIGRLSSAEPQVVPAEPPLAEFRKQAEAAAIVLLCKPNAAGTGLEVSIVLKGQEEYDAAKDQIAKLIPKGDPKALSKDRY